MKSERVQEIEKVFQDLVNPTIAEHSQKFFQTHQGGYGEGDKFLGIRNQKIKSEDNLVIILYFLSFLLNSSSFFVFISSFSLNYSY